MPLPNSMGNGFSDLPSASHGSTLECMYAPYSKSLVVGVKVEAEILSINGCFVRGSFVSDVYFWTGPYTWGEKCFLLCSCCRTPAG